MKTFTSRSRSRVIAALSLFLLAVGSFGAGCADRDELVPVTASSATSPAYAEEFPDRMTTIRQLYVEQTKQAREDTKALPSFPDALDEPDWDLVAKIYGEADEAGRSQALVDALREERAIRAFLEDNDRDIGRRIGVHVNSTLKRGTTPGCEYPTGAGTARAVTDAFDRQLEKRYEGLHEGHLTLERHGEELGTKNVEPLAEQIDTITKTSFTVFVDAVMLRNELDRLMEDLETVQETLNKAIAAERAVKNDANSTKAQKAAADERIEELQAAKTPLTGLRHNAEQTRETMDDDIVAMREAYQSALEKLLSDVSSRTSAPE